MEYQVLCSSFSISAPIDPEQEDGNMADDDVQAAKSNHIKFGDCFISDSRTLGFSMTNHSANDCIRFQWPEHPQLKFSPMVRKLFKKKTAFALHIKMYHGLKSFGDFITNENLVYMFS